MRRLLIGVGALSLGALGLIEFGCNGSTDICFGDACGAIADGGNDADGQVIPANCDLAKDPKDSVACVDESIAYFVSAAGSDSNVGTKSSPFKSINAALAKVNSQHSRVYVCEGTYGETVKVTAAVGIYGGFHCADWSYDANQGKVGPADKGYALDIEGVSGSVTIEDLEFDAQNGQNPGDSSIAVFVSSSTATLKRVKAVAGNGATGSDAVVASNWDGGAAQSGTSVTEDAGFGNVGAGSCVTVCKDGAQTVGGSGGSGGLTGGAAGADGGPAIAENPTGLNPPHNGAGGQACGGLGAHPGADGAIAEAGAAGGTKSGSLTSTGWTLLSGSSGANGKIGQGGGGGGGGMAAANTGGGGGGCGGCGGAGGAGGNAGGSAFAMLVYQSTLTIDGCALEVGKGGDGKAGGGGQTGQSGGGGGLQAISPVVGNGCPGAIGGKGGEGAGGGGGAGGNAIAIGYVGTKPTLTSTTMSEGTAGAPGAGGTGAAGNDGLPGAAGTKADTQELP